MLSRELMGVMCLGVVWVTALLVAAAALRDLADLRRVARRARGAIVGIAQGDLAEWKAEQTARAIDVSGGDEAIAFHERRFVSDILGGSVQAGDVTYDVSPSKTGQVWVSEEARVAATSCPDAAMFDLVYAQAKKAKGASRDAVVRIGKGDRVFVVGKLLEESRTIDPEIVSTLDPVAFCRQKSLPLALFIPLELVTCGLATALALQPPHFGRLSIAGAICCFAFFLGVTPLGVALREAVRRPHEAFLRAKWTRVS